MNKLYELVDDEELTKCNDFFIYFTAKWCNKCKNTHDELIDFISTENNKWYKIDVDEFSDTSIEYEVQKLPEYLYINDNKVMFRCNTLEELKKFLKSLILGKMMN